MIIKRNRNVCILIILLLMMVLLSCNSNGTQNENWSISSRGEFATCSIELAQKALSFTIIIPGYLPSDLAHSPYVVGRSKEVWPADDQEIRIAYNNFSDDTLKSAVIVTERSYKVFPPGSGTDNSDRYSEIAGVEVVQAKAVMDAVAGDGWYMLDGTGFWWDSQGITFTVEVYGYSQEEAIRIVASMIEQE